MNPIHKLIGAVSMLGAIGELVEALSYAVSARTERRILERISKDPSEWHTIRMGDCVFLGATSKPPSASWAPMMKKKKTKRRTTKMSENESEVVELNASELTEYMNRVASVKRTLHACSALLFAVGAGVACVSWGAAAVPLAIAPIYLWMALQ